MYLLIPYTLLSGNKIKKRKKGRPIRNSREK